MSSVADTLRCRIAPTTLIVLLPGAYDNAQDFIDQGFVASVREKKIHADIQIVDAHTGYYSQQQILQRLDDEVVKPARMKGYAQIWFSGISLGGYGTLLYAMNRPGALEGFFLMAPYMGPQDLISDIDKEGGLKSWSSSAQGNKDVDLWRWIQNYATGESGLPKAYLGYGASDRFEKPNTLMAKVLPAAQSFVITGGHDWSTWRTLWSTFLANAPLPRIEAAQASCKSS